MQRGISLKSKVRPLPVVPLRAIIEIIGGELTVYPVGNSDADEKVILDALRFLTRSFVARDLEVSECTVDNLAKSGRLPSIMTTAKRRVFRKSDVDACKAKLKCAARTD